MSVASPARRSMLIPGCKNGAGRQASFLDGPRTRDRTVLSLSFRCGCGLGDAGQVKLDPQAVLSYLAPVLAVEEDLHTRAGGNSLGKDPKIPKGAAMDDGPFRTFDASHLICSTSRRLMVCNLST